MTAFWKQLLTLLPFLQINCFKYEPNKFLSPIKEVAEDPNVFVPLQLSMEGVPLELVQHATAGQLLVLNKLSQQNIENSTIMTARAVWAPFLKD